MSGVQAAQQGGLVGYWKLDESSGPAVDVSGNGNDGTYGNNPAPDGSVPTTNFPNSRSLGFSGDDSVTVDNPFTAGQTDFTVSLWVNPATLSTGVDYQGLIGREVGEESTDRAPGLWISPSGGGLHYNVFSPDTSTSYDGVIPDVFTSTDQWVQITWVKNGTELDFYKNGSLILGDQPAPETFYVGDGSYNFGLIDKYFQGKLDDIRIYDRALSSDEVDELGAGDHTSAQWTGASSTEWNNPANWDIGAVPDAHTNVTVPDTENKPALSADVGVADLTIETGAYLILGGHDLTVNDSGSFSNEGTLYLRGDETLTNFTNDTDSGTVSYIGNGAYTGLPTGNDYFKIDFNGSGGSWTLDDSLDVNSNIGLYLGTLSTGGNTINLAGDWLNVGSLTFNHDNGSVILDGASQSIRGTNTFYNLTKSVTSTQTVWFEAGETQTVTHNLTLNGASSDVLALLSGTLGSPWQIDATGATTNLQHLYVQDSTNIAVSALSAEDSIDGDRNVNWDITPPDTTSPSVTSVTTPGDGSWEYYGLDGHIDFTVNFDENVTVNTTGGTPHLVINTEDAPNPTLYADYIGGSGTDSLVFRYSVQAGDENRVDTLGVSIVANGGTLRDTAGNNANLTLNSVQDMQSIQFDGIAPAVQSITPQAVTDSTVRSFWVSFNDNVEGVDTNDFSLTRTGTADGTIESVVDTGGGSLYSVTVNGISGDGTLRLDLKSSGTGIVDYGTENPISGGYTSGHVFTIDNTAPLTPAASPDGGTYGSAQSVTLNTLDPDATIYYTTDGSTPDNSDTEYASPLAISSSTIVKAIAYDSAGNTSGVMSESYVIDTVGPGIGNIQAVSPGDGESATITWVTDEAASSQVAIGLTSNLVNAIYVERDTSPRVISHSYELTDLEPCTRYYYQVLSKDALNHQTVSTVQAFTSNGCVGTVTGHAEELIETSSGGSLSLGDVTVIIPSGFAAGDATFQIKRIVASEAVGNISKPSNYLVVGGYMYEIKALTDTSTVVENFLQPITIMFSYGASDLTGKDPATLTIYHHDDTGGWTELNSCDVDATAKTASCQTSSFSTFALVAAAASAQSSGGSSSDANVSSPGAPNTGLLGVNSGMYLGALAVGIGLVVARIVPLGKLYDAIRKKN